MINTCAICGEPIKLNESAHWTHVHGDIYCGTGDGAMAVPQVVVVSPHEFVQMKTRVEGLEYIIGGPADDETPYLAREESDEDAERRYKDAIRPLPRPWDEDDEYPMADWRYEVGNGDTLQGYTAWVATQRRYAADDEQ